MFGHRYFTTAVAYSFWWAKSHLFKETIHWWHLISWWLEAHHIPRNWTCWSIVYPGGTRPCWQSGLFIPKFSSGSLDVRHSSYRLVCNVSQPQAPYFYQSSTRPAGSPCWHPISELWGDVRLHIPAWPLMDFFHGSRISTILVAGESVATPCHQLLIHAPHLSRITLWVLQKFIAQNQTMARGPLGHRLYSIPFYFQSCETFLWVNPCVLFSCIKPDCSLKADNIVQRGRHQ